MSTNPFGYTPGDVLRALAARDGEASYDGLAADLGRRPNEITLGLQRLMMEGYIAVSAGARVARLTQKGREHLYEDDLLDTWN